MAEKISVIIPAKDRVEFTKEALNSILMQRLPKNTKVEIILVDDMSNPPLAEQIEKDYPLVRFLKNKSKKHGPGSSRNTGLLAATGNYVAFLDNDDQWKQNFMINSLSRLRNSDVAATVCLSDLYFFGDFPIKAKFKLMFLNVVRTGVLSLLWLLNGKKLPLAGFYLCQISHMVFNMRHVKGLKFNETTAAAEDWEYNVGATANKPINIILKRLVKFRYEISSNTFNKSVRQNKEQAYYNLLDGLPESHNKGLFNVLFRQYIKYFLVK